jgi:hypothetical protein
MVGMVKAALSGLLMESNKFDSPKRTLPRGGSRRNSPKRTLITMGVGNLFPVVFPVLYGGRIACVEIKSGKENADIALVSKKSTYRFRFIMARSFGSERCHHGMLCGDLIATKAM